jgi:paraquat-inducible protein A
MSSVIVCPSCDLAHRAGREPPTTRMRCARCLALLQRPENGNIDAAIGLAAAAFLLFLLSNAYPLVAIESNGATRATTLLGATLGLYRQDHALLAALVFLTTIVSPFLQIATLLYLLIPLRRGREARGQTLLFRLLTQVRPWTFVEVFMLGAVVALVRLASFARVMPGIALWSCVFLMMALAALTSRTSPGQFWRWVEQNRA